MLDLESLTSGNTFAAKGRYIDAVAAAALVDKYPLR
jgi:hypothetical protein